MNFNDICDTNTITDHFRNNTKYTNPNVDPLVNQRIHKVIETNTSNTHRIIEYTAKMPEFGINVGHIPLKDLHKNGVYYESNIQRGIEGRNYNCNVSNLVPLKSTKMDKIKFFNKPESNCMIPRPLVIEKYQRPIIP